MKTKNTLNHFVSIRESEITIQGFLYKSAGARKNKYGVHICTNLGETLVLFTFASTYEEAFQIAEAAYQASPHPKVGIGHFVVHGICQSRTCRCGGQWRVKIFPVDWSTSR